MSSKGSDEEFEYESASDISEMDPESEVLAPVQRRIEEQLRKHLQEVSQQLHEQENEFKMVEKDREDCGVELYNSQQHLAKLQETLEKLHDKHSKFQMEHEEKLQLRDSVSKDVESLQQRIDTTQKQLNARQDELAKLSETLQKVERFNDDLKNEVELERRAAHKTEDDITKLEREKLRQDELITAMQQRVQTLEDQAALLREQVSSQKTETKMAKDTVAEAMSEMEAINMEKKQLVQQWKSSLLGMQRRHDALRKAEEALQQQKSDLQVLENEIGGARRQLQETEVENGKLMEFLSRVDNEITILEKQMDTLLEKRDKNASTYAMMQSAVEKSDAETKEIEKQMKDQNKIADDLRKQIEKHAKAIVDMENDVLQHLSKQTTLKQESQGTLHDIEKIKQAIRAKELQVSQMENELARIRVDTLQAKAYNDTLQSTLDELNKELQSRGVLIERMQVDIRRRNEEIDKKQKQLDQLNHQYEQIMAAHGGEKGEHVGPLEATINSLSKAIATKSAENEALQQEWIKLQTELVSCKNTVNDINEAIQDAQARTTILTQKRDRLLAKVTEEKQELASLEKKADHMHLEMKRVNTLLNQNNENKETVANDAFLLETDLLRRLQEKKRDALQLEKKVDETRQTKRDLMEQIMNCERDIMFWERKLQVARETEMALDPTIGRAEIEKMKKEIGFMEQRMSQLQREQRFLIEEMQKLVDHRDIIRTKGKAIEQATQNNKTGRTRLAVEKENARLFKELITKRQEAQARESAVRENLAEVERTVTEVERVQRDMETAEEEMEHLQEQLVTAQKERERTEDEKRLKQNSLQRFREGEKGTYQLTCYPEEAQAESTRLDQGRRTVIEIMEELANQFPDIAPDLQDLMPMV